MFRLLTESTQHSVCLELYVRKKPLKQLLSALSSNLPSGVESVYVCLFSPYLLL